jgi:ribosome-associated protein
MNIPADGPHPALPDGFRIVEISREPIELYKILKFEGIAESGGHARAAVASGRVLVNGVVEIQKRKKIRSGDTIEIGDDKLLIHFCASAVPDAKPAKAEIKHTLKPEGVTSAGGGALVKRVKKP